MAQAMLYSLEHECSREKSRVDRSHTSEKSSLTFFDEMPAFTDITGVTNSAYYVDVPEDWIIAMSDVRDSTAHVRRGQYKAVNAVAAASITAVLNLFPRIDVPFVFGGDGAAILIPPAYADDCSRALRAVRHLARTQFDIDLRVGMIPVRDVCSDGYTLRVSKLAVSTNFKQAIFTGGGMAYAEKLLKDPIYESHYTLPYDDSDAQLDADYTGFECRWNQMPPQHDETLSLIVQVNERQSENARTAVYNQVLNYITDIYGDSERRRPFHVEQMRVSLNLDDYRIETGVRQRTQQFIQRLKLMLYSFAGFLLWNYRDKIWERYRETVLNSTDHEKFDDMLRMVISGIAEQRRRLVSQLEEMRQRGRLYYGIHVSTHALMTCLVFDRFGRQVHFVDGSSGGYAAAAVMLKRQVKEGAN